MYIYYILYNIYYMLYYLTLYYTILYYTIRFVSVWFELGLDSAREGLIQKAVRHASRGSQRADRGRPDRSQRLDAVTGSASPAVP